MLNKDYSGAIQNAVRNSLSLDFSPIPNKLEQLPEVLSTGLDDWNNTMRKQAYENALKSGNQEEIDKALAEYNPEAYANVLTAREQRQQALEDAQVERDFKKELLDLQTQRALQLEGIRQGNAMKLAEFKAGLDGNTTAQKNISYLQSLGYSPEEAAALYYSGNNPTLDMSKLGKKGFEAYDKKIGETLAGKTEAADLLAQTEQAYNDLFKDGGLIQQAKIGADMPDSVAGRVGGIFDRFVPTNLVDKEAQQARQQIQYILGGLRLDESAAMKGALSDSEQKFLSDMVAGNVKGYSPWEIKGAFEGIMNKLRRKAGSPSLKDFQNTNEEVIDYTDL